MKKMLKKVFSVFLAVVMLMSTIVIPASAAGDTVALGFANGAWNGDTYAVDLVATGASNTFELYSAEIYVSFDNSVLKLTGFSNGNVPTGLDEYGDESSITYSKSTLNESNANGYCVLALSDANAANHTITSGVTKFATLRFTKVDAEVESCTTQLGFAVFGKENVLGYYDGGNQNYTVSSAATHSVAVAGALPTINTVTLASSTVNVAGGSAAAQTVQASAASVKGTNITNGVIWSVSPEGKGVTIGADGKISVTAMAEEGNYTITAAQKSGASQGASKTATLQVVRAASVPTTITVSGGQSSIIVPDDDATEDNVSTAFTAEVKDQFGAVITPAISWLILDGDDPVTGVTIADGVVTVSKIAKTPIPDATGKTLTVKAKVTVAGDTISDTATITVKRAEPKLKVFMVEGADTLAVPTAAARTASATYTVANGRDQYAAEYSLTGKAVTWGFETTTGVVLSNGILTAEPSDTAGSVEISAQIEGVTAVKNVAITKAASAATSIKVFKQTGSGEPAELTGNTDTVIIPTSDTANTYKYTAQLYDQYGAEMAGDVVLTFVTADEKVTYSSGTVTVSKGATKDKTYTLTASYTDVADVVITITAKDIDITAPTVTPNAATYGMKWSEIIPDSKIVGGSASLNGVTVAGDFYLKNDGNAYPEAGDQAYEIWFKSTDGNYDLKVLGGSVNVGKAQITVTLGTIEKVYGETVSLSTLTSSVTSGAPVAGDTAVDIQIVPACDAAADVNADVGEVAITGAATAETAKNYNVTVVSGKLIITKRPLTVNAGTLVISKVYDATTNAGTAESGALGLTGIVNSDDVSVSYTTIGAYDDADVGTGKAVMIRGLSLSGTDAGNYSITATQQQISSGEITKADLTAEMLQFTPVSATYDGTAKTVTVSLKSPYTGMGEVTVKYDGAAEAVAAKTYAVTVAVADGTNFNATSSDLALGSFTINPKSIAGVTVEGLDPNGYEYDGSAKTPAITVKDGSVPLTKDTDYTVAYTNNTDVGTATITITGKGNYSEQTYKTVTFRITKTQPKLGAGKDYTVTLPTELTYDGNGKAATVAKLNDAIGNITVRYNGSTTVPVNAGTYAVTVDITETANYASMSNVDCGSFTIAPKSIAGVTVDEIAALTYNGREQTPTVSVKDGTKTLYNGTDYTVAYADNKDAGTATITITGKGNYDSATSKPVNFTINKAALTVKAANQTIGYGSALNTDNVQVSYTGFVNGETIANLDGALAFDTTYTTTSAVGGEYTVTPKGWTSDNYAITFVAGKITVTAKNLNDNDVTVDAIAALTYNGTAQTPAPVVKNGSILLVAGEGKDYTVTYSNNTNAGTATVTITGIGNYTGVRRVTFTINQIAAELSWSGHTSLVYDGQAKDVTATVTNLAATDAGQVSVIVSNGRQINAGTYTATAAGLSGTKAANYKLAIPAPTQEYTIAPKSITGVTVAEIAALTYNGREQTPAVSVKDGTKTLYNGTDYTVAYADNKDAGTATVTITGKGNYDSATTKAVNFTINKAALTVKAANQTIGYGSALNTDNVQVSYTGFVNGETIANLDGALAFDTTYTTTSAVGGEYTVTPKGWNSDNYAITFVAGNITVTAKNVADADVVVEVTGTYTYNAAEQTPTYTVKNNGVALVADTDFTAVVSNNINAGTATITLTGIGNYTGTKTATFTIEKKEVGLTWTNSGTLYYNGKSQSVTAEATGLETADEGKVNVTVAGGDKTEIGVYTAAATGLTGEKAANYKLPAANTADYTIVAALTEVTVTPATITATIDGLTIKLVGYKAESDTVTVEGGGQNADDGKLTVNGVKYTVDDSGVVVNESSATLEEVAPTVSKQDGATITDEVVNALAPSVDGLKEAVAEAVFKAAEANDTITTVEVSLLIEALSYADSKLKLEITPVVTYKAGSTVVGDANQVLPNSQIKAPITVSVKLPDGFTPNLAKHALANGQFEYLPVTITAGVASWQQSSFSEVELISDARTATVTYNFDNGTAQTITYTAADLGKALPTDSKAGNTFNGWTFTTTGDTKYTAMTDELLTALNGLTVSATSEFTAAAGGFGGGAVIKKEEEVKNPFEDVFESDYYYDAVLWAVEKGITTGVTETSFVPGAACNRGQMVTFLWREAGKPEPKTTENPFTDVSKDAYYYKAVLWAVEQGITNGVTETSFAPGQACTRAQMATFLWRAAGKKDSAFKNVFTDVKDGAYYYDAVLWAAERGITLGKTETTFVPNDACTRGQMVTFLYRNAKADK